MATTLSNFGIPTGDAFSRGGILMPKIKNRYRILVANFGYPNAAVGFTQQVVSAARPNVNFNPQTIHSYNSIAYYAGKAEWEPVTVTVRDDVTNSVSRLIGAQMQRQMNFFDQTVPMGASDYKFSMLIEMLDGGGNTAAGQDAVVLEQWVFEGCFLASVNYETLDYSSADAMTIELSVRYDNATQSGGLMPEPPVMNFPNPTQAIFAT